jgi:hypothetical protein
MDLHSSVRSVICVDRRDQNFASPVGAAFSAPDGALNVCWPEFYKDVVPTALLPKEHRAGLLSQLARQGFPVWLASQDADKFLTQGTNETNFAQLATCGVHLWLLHLIRPPASFSPSDAEKDIAADQKDVLGIVINQKFKKAEAALCRSGKLQSTGLARQFWKDGGKQQPT